MADYYDANLFINELIGAPIPMYDDPYDRIPRGVYSIVRPAILNFFAMCNDPHANSAFLRAIMRKIQIRHSVVLPGYVMSLLDRGIQEGLIPSPLGKPDLVWLKEWFTDVFGPEPGPAAPAAPGPAYEFKPKIIIQGGEAVNSYIPFKYENVQTHDADTRILIGDHFHYKKLLDIVDDEATEKMHKFRCFATLGLIEYLYIYIQRIQAPPPPHVPRFDFTSAFVPDWTQMADVEITTDFRNTTYEQKLLSGFYHIYDKENIARLITINITVTLPGIPPMENNGVVDYFIPYEREDLENETGIGQTGNVHTFFSTQQARSMVQGFGTPVPQGRVPSIVLPITLKPTTPGNLAGKTINVTIVPHGFILFETIRMLLVSYKLDELAHDNKLLKYKQKLVTLLTALLDPAISKVIFDRAKNATSKTPAILPLLSGGGNREKIERMEEDIPTVPMPDIQTQEKNDPRVIEEARAFSRKLMDLEEKTIDSSQFTPMQMKGYFDYLSYMDPQFKDFRLPKSDEDRQGRFQALPPPTVTAEEMDFFFSTPTTMSRGGKRYSKTMKKGHRGKTRKN
jgi:hypothetical protein